MIRAKPEVEAMTPYVAPLEGRRPLLRLDFNESTVGPSPKVVDAIRGLPPEAYATYPEYVGLTDAFAASLGVPADRVEAFNGVDAAIRAVFDAYGERGETFLRCGRPRTSPAWPMSALAARSSRPPARTTAPRGSSAGP